MDKLYVGRLWSSCQHVISSVGVSSKIYLKSIAVSTLLDILACMYNQVVVNSASSATAELR